MKIVFAIVFALSSFVFAGNMSDPWKMIDQQTEFAVNEAEFIALQTKYPMYFKKYNPKFVTAAHVVTEIYKYIDVSTCPANDPRLEVKKQSYGICYVTDPNGDEMLCEDTAESMPSPKDPCAP